MTKSVPGPKELAQRAMQEARVTKGAASKKRGLIPYAGKPRMGADHGIFGVKPGPKAQRKAAARKKPK